MTLSQDKKPLAYSLGIHGAILLVLVVRPYFSSPVKPFERSIKVDVIAMPEKGQKIIKKKEGPKKKEEPQEPPKVKEKPKPEPKAKDKPKPEPEPKKTTVSKKKTEPKKQAEPKKEPPKKEESLVSEQDAFKKLEALKAKKNNDSTAEPAGQEPNKIAGNRVSKGSSLVGIEKLEYTNYKEVLHGAISADWQLPKWLLESDLQAVVEIKIDHDGNLVYKNLVQTSGNKIYDEKVMEAVVNAAPFDPPPEKFKGVVLYEGVILTFP